MLKYQKSIYTAIISAVLILNVQHTFQNQNSTCILDEAEKTLKYQIDNQQDKNEFEIPSQRQSSMAESETQIISKQYFISDACMALQEVLTLQLQDQEENPKLDEAAKKLVQYILDQQDSRFGILVHNRIELKKNSQGRESTVFNMLDFNQEESKINLIFQKFEHKSNPDQKWQHFQMQFNLYMNITFYYHNDLVSKSFHFDDVKTIAKGISYEQIFYPIKNNNSEIMMEVGFCIKLLPVRGVVLEIHTATKSETITDIEIWTNFNVVSLNVSSMCSEQNCVQKTEQHPLKSQIKMLDLRKAIVSFGQQPTIASDRQIQLHIIISTSSDRMLFQGADVNFNTADQNIQQAQFKFQISELKRGETHTCTQKIFVTQGSLLSQESFGQYVDYLNSDENRMINDHILKDISTMLLSDCALCANAISQIFLNLKRESSVRVSKNLNDDKERIYQFILMTAQHFKPFNSKLATKENIPAEDLFILFDSMIATIQMYHASQYFNEYAEILDEQCKIMLQFKDIDSGCFIFVSESYYQQVKVESQHALILSFLLRTLQNSNIVFKFKSFNLKLVQSYIEQSKQCLNNLIQIEDNSDIISNDVIIQNYLNLLTDNITQQQNELCIMTRHHHIINLLSQKVDPIPYITYWMTLKKWIPKIITYSLLLMCCIQVSIGTCYFLYRLIGGTVFKPVEQQQNGLSNAEEMQSMTLSNNNDTEESDILHINNSQL